MSLVGTGSPTSKTLKKRCSSASRHISRSGLIRELQWNESQLQKEREKIGSTIVGLQSGEGREGWSREAVTPSAGVPNGDSNEVFWHETLLVKFQQRYVKSHRSSLQRQAICLAI